MSCRMETLPTSCSMCERISWLDGWRGIVCWLMIVYHFLFDLSMFGWMSWDAMMSWPMAVLEKIISCSFILCAGISARFTRSNLRRGLITSAAGLAVVAVSFMIGAPIRFGVLQFLGLAMLLYAAVGRCGERIPDGLAPVLWLFLFAVSYAVTDSALVDAHWLYWLGLKYDGFVSFDYFPMLPYIFLFFLGSRLGKIIKSRRKQLPFLEKQAPAWLVWPGRHTLWIYLLHQPVLYGICLIFYLF